MVCTKYAQISKIDKDTPTGNCAKNMQKIGKINKKSRLHKLCKIMQKLFKMSEKQLCKILKFWQAS